MWISVCFRQLDSDTELLCLELWGVRLDNFIARIKDYFSLWNLQVGTTHYNCILRWIISNLVFHTKKVAICQVELNKEIMVCYVNWCNSLNRCSSVARQQGWQLSFMLHVMCMRQINHFDISTMCPTSWSDYMFMSWLSYQDVKGNGSKVIAGQDSYQAINCSSRLCFKYL